MSVSAALPRLDASPFPSSPCRISAPSHVAGRTATSTRRDFHPHAQSCTVIAASARTHHPHAFARARRLLASRRAQAHAHQEFHCCVLLLLHHDEHQHQHEQHGRAAAFEAGDWRLAHSEHNMPKKYEQRRRHQRQPQQTAAAAAARLPPQHLLLCTAATSLRDRHMARAQQETPATMPRAPTAAARRVTHMRACAPCIRVPMCFVHHSPPSAYQRLYPIPLRGLKSDSALRS